MPAAIEEKRVPLSARVPKRIMDKLQDVAAQSHRSLTDVTIEALAGYVGEEVVTVGDRLTALEEDVATLKRKLVLLAE